MKEALFYEKLQDGRVRCGLCHHRCVIAQGERGLCAVRENRDGVLYSLVYGKVVSANVDPVEKKPFFHFQPGSRSFSIATVGCNFKCLHCQNWTISQLPRDRGEVIGEWVPPEVIVEEAKRRGCRSISYTYTEPTVFFEYAYEVAKLAKAQGLRNLFVTNGYMSLEALEFIAPYLDGANVDLKAFSDKFYQEICGARLEPVLSVISRMRQLGIWVEVTTLLIPGLNDDREQLRQLAAFIKSVDPAIPWHVTAFHPDYRLLTVPPTPVTALKKAREIGLREGLRYVYSGNVPGAPGEDTYCYGCGELLIKRWGFRLLENRVQKGRCPRCGALIDGVEL